MGDRCHMTVYCRPQDVPRFEELGFTAQIDPIPPDATEVEMIDEEANYAHFGDLPTDIPYHGWHHEGGDYGPAEFACDGTTYAEWETGHGISGYVFPDLPDDLANPGPVYADTFQQFRAFKAISHTALTILNPHTLHA